MLDEVTSWIQSYISMARIDKFLRMNEVIGMPVVHKDHWPNDHNDDGDVDGFAIQMGNISDSWNYKNQSGLDSGSYGDSVCGPCILRAVNGYSSESTDLDYSIVIRHVSWGWDFQHLANSDESDKPLAPLSDLLGCTKCRTRLCCYQQKKIDGQWLEESQQDIDIRPSRKDGAKYFLFDDFEFQIVLQDVNISIPKGHLVAAVGPTGSGKVWAVYNACRIVSMTLTFITVYFSQWSDGRV